MDTRTSLRLLAALTLILGLSVAAPQSARAATITVGCAADAAARAQALVDAFAQSEAQAGPDSIALMRRR